MWQIIFFESCIVLKIDTKIQIELLILEIKAVTKISALVTSLKGIFFPLYFLCVSITAWGKRGQRF